MVSAFLPFTLHASPTTVTLQYNGCSLLPAGCAFVHLATAKPPWSALFATKWRDGRLEAIPGMAPVALASHHHLVSCLDFQILVLSLICACFLVMFIYAIHTLKIAKPAISTNVIMSSMEGKRVRPLTWRRMLSHSPSPPSMLLHSIGSASESIRMAIITTVPPLQHIPDSAGN